MDPLLPYPELEEMNIADPRFVICYGNDAQFMSRKTSAIIVSIHKGKSHDSVYTQRKHISYDGSKTLVFSINSTATDILLEGFYKVREHKAIKLLFNEIEALGIRRDAVIFNWECCNGYSLGELGEEEKNLCELVRQIMKGHHTVIFSDWSLKALIKNWDPDILGPNPFLKMAAKYEGPVTLRFDKQKMLDSSIYQMQIVAELSEDGSCIIDCSPMTLIYTLNQKAIKSEEAKKFFKKVELLTVAQGAKADQPSQIVEIGGAKGTAGHVAIEYYFGGKLLVSMTHWKELKKISVSKQNLYMVAKKKYGVAQAEKVGANFQLAPPGQKEAFILKTSQQYIQETLPINYIEVDDL